MALRKRKNNNSKSKPIDFKYNLKVYWSFVKKYKAIIIGVLLLTLFFQGFHVTERYLFKVIMDQGADYLANQITREVFVKTLITIATVFLTLLSIQVIFRWVWLSLINKFETSAMLDLKKKMFDHVIQLDHEFHANNKTGSMISKLIRGANSVERLSDVFIFNFAPLLFQVLVVSGSIMLFDKTSALVVIITVALFIG